MYMYIKVIAIIENKRTRFHRPTCLFVSNSMDFDFIKRRRRVKQRNANKKKK